MKISSKDVQIEGRLIDNKELRKKASQWASLVRKQAKQNTSQFTKGKKQPHTYKSEIYKGKTEPKLKDTISYIIRERDGVLSHVGFRFPLHGIYQEWGVGSGQPRVTGKKKAKKIYIKRSMTDWIDDPIKNNFEKFADIVAEFYGDDAVVNAYNMMVKKI